MPAAPPAPERGSDAPAPWASPDVPVWALRVLWLLTGVAVGAALDAALASRSGGVVVVTVGLGWAVWLAVLVAALVPRATSLTAVRAGVPLALLAALVAAAAEGGALGIVAVVLSAAGVALVLSPAVGDRFVDGSSYGSERRFALRTPLALAGLAVLAWLALAAGLTVGPLLLGAGRLAAGVAATVVGAAVVVAAGRALHQLSRRWLVMVPTGVVVHDPVARPDSVMAPRPRIVGLGPAPADSDALDLTLGASGLALELRTDAPLPITVRTGRSRDLTTAQVSAVLLTPSRPAAVLAEARARRLPSL